MKIKTLLYASESYTHDNWVYRDVFVGFSRLYYIIDGEAYYEEEGRVYRLKKNHIYLTPVKKYFSLYENPDNKLLHTYAHITTFPEVTEFREIEVISGTPLSDGVELWRKYINSGNRELLTNIIQFVLSCLTHESNVTQTAGRVKDYIDSFEGADLDMAKLCAELGYSREHLTRSFSATYNVTPKHYFNMRIMNTALEKLQSGEKVTEVADALNYASPYSFSKAFKNYFGLSPKNYMLALKTDPTHYHSE